MSNQYKIGIVEEEDAWIETFKRKLKNDFQLFVFELTDTTETIDIIDKIKSEEIDCIIADFELNETEIIRFNGDKLIEDIKKVYPLFPMFIITGKDEDYVLNQVDEEDSDIVRDKNEVTSKTEALITRIKNKISSYKGKILEAEDTIKKIVIKKNQGNVLTVLEEEILTERYQYLEKINPLEKTLPSNFIQPENISNLNVFVSDTKKILDELKKLSK